MLRYCAILLIIGYCYSQSIFDPRVFNVYFYLNWYPDLTRAGINTVEAAQNHWQTYGLSEGRQASGNFHILQYLQRYPQLKEKFGTNYREALLYYLSTGFRENQQGFVEGGAYGRYTVYNPESQIYVSASYRMAGGIDSVVWNGNEFINCWDHGRELQLAISNGNGECYNPTECGSSDDSQKLTTTSRLLSVSAVGSNLQTLSLPAFWLAPGQREPNPSPTCTVAKNTVLLSDYMITKNVTIGVGNIQNAIEYRFAIKIPQNDAQFQVEGPTGYMTIDYSDFFSIDLSTGRLTPVSHAAGEIAEPLVFSTPNGQYAMGAFVKYAEPGTTVTYAKFFFALSPLPNGTSKWSNVMRTSNVRAGTEYTGLTYICVGSLEQVALCMVQVNRI